ncbi:DUF2920 family protein [Campylobacter lari]|uniref:DUF2920 family protein n=1 Tax=Campylobacter lari TaxID=201 RepID=UPI003D9FD4D9
MKYWIIQKNIEKYYQILDQKMSILKEQGILNQDYKVELSVTFIPPNNEYNNFAIMPAIDHINALKDIMKNYPQFKSLPKIYGGGRVIRWFNSTNVCKNSSLVCGWSNR